MTLVFFRRIGERMSDFLPKKSKSNKTRVYPWFISNDIEFGYVLKHSKTLQILNFDDLIDLRCVKYYKALTNPNVIIHIPKGAHGVGLLYKNDGYMFPYVIVSERDYDCRLFIFNNESIMKEWLEGLDDNVDIDKHTRGYLGNKLRVVRVYYNKGRLFDQNTTMLSIEFKNDVKETEKENKLSLSIKSINKKLLSKKTKLLKQEKYL